MRQKAMCQLISCLYQSIGEIDPRLTKVWNKRGSRIKFEGEEGTQESYRYIQKKEGGFECLKKDDKIGCLKSQ